MVVFGLASYCYFIELALPLMAPIRRIGLVNESGSHCIWTTSLLDIRDSCDNSLPCIVLHILISRACRAMSIVPITDALSLSLYASSTPGRLRRARDS